MQPVYVTFWQIWFKDFLQKNVSHRKNNDIYWIQIWNCISFIAIKNYISSTKDGLMTLIP